ncbi:zf-HC2 domain-containing protein [Protofrankia symbiont of Coriaria ruscifolia]|uniref:zf-HC2 domain-containing protein n=1 Tax=Protofrankia symbiont of Coriaria ruscifolia TaxID=1306542 RepID=UPI001041283C|nr:zf-HC2 domain-containing protein [Protofrankia symbiont of Coriaria ruscifolia]
MTPSLRTALAGGGRAAVSDLMDTHHGFAVLLAKAVGAGSATVRVVERAWVDTVAAVVSDAGTPVRPACSVRSCDCCERTANSTRPTPTPPPTSPPTPRRPRAGFFLPPDDRWAGWWDVDVPSWPAGRIPTAEQVLHAVRCLPLRQRTLLILRDSARLSTDETADSLGVEPDDQGRLLDDAREAYVAYLDEEIRAGDVGAPDIAGTPDHVGALDVESRGIAGETGTRALDISCDVVFDLVGAWYDGELTDNDQNAFEQHLLFCPPCPLPTAIGRDGH